MGNYFNIKELIKWLSSSSVPEYCWQIGAYKDFALCIENEGNTWEVYEGERGNKYNKKLFNTENEACEYFKTRILQIL